MIIHTGFSWNYTTFLNIVALAGFAVIYWLYRHRDTSSGRFAKDPACGMQVEIAHAPATRRPGGQSVHFCSDHCARRFGAGPARYLAAAPGASDVTGEDDTADEVSTIDQVCGMRVETARAQYTAGHVGRTHYFCGAGCRTALLTDPDQYTSAELGQHASPRRFQHIDSRPHDDPHPSTDPRQYHADTEQERLS